MFISITHTSAHLDHKKEKVLLRYGQLHCIVFFGTHSTFVPEIKKTHEKKKEKWKNIWNIFPIICKQIGKFKGMN